MSTKARNLLQRCTLEFLFFNGALMELTGKAFVLNTMFQTVVCDLNQAMSLLTILRQALTEARGISLMYSRILEKYILNQISI